MKRVAVAVLIATIAACSSSSSSNVADAGGTSSTPSCSTTTCDPMLDPYYFQSATPASFPSLTTVCPDGSMQRKTAGPFAVTRFTTEADLESAFCIGADGGADAGASTSPIDFSRSDVLVIDGVQEESLSFVQVGGQTWLRIDAGCGGGPPPPPASAVFYEVPKNVAVESETCTTTCSYDNGCPPPPP